MHLTFLPHRFQSCIGCMPRTFVHPDSHVLAMMGLLIVHSCCIRSLGSYANLGAHIQRNLSASKSQNQHLKPLAHKLLYEYLKPTLRVKLKLLSE